MEDEEGYFGIPKHWGKGIYGGNKKTVIEGHRSEPFENEKSESPKEERAEKKSKSWYYF